MTQQETSKAPRLEAVLVWKLEGEVEHTRNAIIHRARSLAERLTRLADDLETDPEAGFNAVGVLQGNGVELDAWCQKLGFARDTLKMVRQAKAADEKERESQAEPSLAPSNIADEVPGEGLAY